MEHILVLGEFYDGIVDMLQKNFTVHHIKDREKFAELDENTRQKITGLVAMGWCPKAAIDNVPNLKVISSFGVGYDGVDSQYAASKNILVGHTPSVLDDEVANTGIALMLAVTRKIVAYDKYIRAKRWENEGLPPLTHGLRGKKVGILGLGRIGMALVEKLNVFGCEILYHNRNKKDVPFTYCNSVLELAQQSDILVLIAPGGAETENIINEEILNAIGPQGTLINIARGSLVDEVALVKALKEKKLGAAGLDVFVKEPFVPHELFQFENVVLAPHVGSATVETRLLMAQRTVENLEQFFANGKPINTIPECQHLI